MASWFNKLKSAVSSAIQKIKNILPNLKRSTKIENRLRPLKNLEHFTDANKYIQTKEDIKKREERKK